MTKVDFYTGVDDKLRTACHLSHKAMQNGLRVLLHTPDASTAEALDKLLWQYPVTAFIPHCYSDEPAAAEMQVVIDHHGETFPHNEVLISLHTVCLPFFSRFERVLEIVSQNTEDARLGRERFSFYRDRGYEMRHFDLSKQLEH
ncbi:DNA polymerase III chi subunit [Candidatus Nitrotoga sp. HW29]|uniref:DNA polymerase III subunit chi n=1 Tax=Candidatus Nitrotoga sp. HW29 TaxID=2886963 RepID=UPI001EF16EE1|nr:DNA polymerase III subunit chi [Candidatus Nitrotoga sp. HW29]CAH1903799.1 DNA polymerase III chi subunit [Candidatus Nitrotoga sp. HW29]